MTSIPVGPNLTPTSATPTAFTSTPTPGFIHFDDASNFVTGRIFDSGGGIKTFGWKPSNVSFDLLSHLTQISWLARNDSAFEFDDFSPVIQALDPRTGSFPSDSAITNVTNRGAILTLSNDKVALYYHRIMAIRLDWETTNHTGWSQSGIFTVLDAVTQADTTNMDNKVAASLNDAQGVELQFNKTSADSSSNSTISSPSTTGTHPQFGNVGSAAGGNGIIVGAMGERGHALSLGAKAGIGVAAGFVGALLLVGILFLFLRRKKSPSPRSGDRNTDAALLNPESPKLADEASSSPAIPAPQMEIPALQHENAAPFPAPGSRAVGPVSVDGDNTSLNPAPESLPTGVSRHLVEEGMTREQILLLEEEERHLDAEIARASRRV